MINEFTTYEIYIYPYNDEIGSLTQPNYPRHLLKQTHVCDDKDVAFKWAGTQIAFLECLDMDAMYEAAVYGVDENNNKTLIGYV